MIYCVEYYCCVCATSQLRAVARSCLTISLNNLPTCNRTIFRLLHLHPLCVYRIRSTTFTYFVYRGRVSFSSAFFSCFACRLASQSSSPSCFTLDVSVARISLKSLYSSVSSITHIMLGSKMSGKSSAWCTHCEHMLLGCWVLSHLRLDE